MKVLLRAIYPYIYLLLFLTIPFDNYVRVLPNILMAALVVIFPFVVAKSDLRKVRKIPAIAFFLFLVYITLNAVIFNRISEDFVTINKIGLALGLAVLYIPVQSQRKISMAIIFSSLAAILFSIIKIVIIINISEDIALGYSREVIEALLIDRLYLGMLSILSVLISYQSISRRFHPNNQYHLINIIINILFVFLMVSKIAIIVLGALFVLRLLYSKRNSVRITAIVIALACVTLLFFSIQNLNREHSDLAIEDRTERSFLENTVTWELRTTVWKCGLQVAKAQGIILEGLGFIETKESLIDCYENTIDENWKRNKYVNMGYNSHNQFIDLYLNFGLIALILFVVFLISAFAGIRKHYFPMAMLVTLVSYLLVENVFHRQIGAYYVGFILIVLLSSNFLSQNNAIKED
jgi:O-antigen ligase